jgi:arylsulfatase A-like enzyme
MKTSALVLGSLLLLTTCSESAETAKPRPNVIVIVSDDQGYGDFGFTGNKVLKTPHLDALFSQSACFTNFHVSPVCSPSRASIMTGRYNYRTGIWDTWKGRAGMRGDEVTIAEILSQVGYATGIFGKWHLGESQPQRPSDQGFQQAPVIAGRFDPVVIKNGKSDKRQGFLDDIVFDEAMSYIESCHKENKPFFAYVASFLPHDVVSGKAVPDEYVKPYESSPGLTAGDKEIYGMISKLDENIGRLLAKVRELGIDRDTVVMFLPDNGMLTNSPDLKSEPEILACRTHQVGQRFNAGLRGGKATIYEGGIRVPLLVRWTDRFQPNPDVGELTAHIDLLPTILDLCGVQAAAKNKIDGRSLVPLLEGRPAGWDDRSLVIQCHRVEQPQKFHECAVFQGNYKLLNGNELYDVKADPGEKIELSARHPELVAKMNASYEKWFADVTGRGFEMSEVWLGSPEQKQLDLAYDHKFSTGWALKVIKKGSCRFVIKGIRHEIFGKNGAFTLVTPTGSHTKAIDPGSDELAFDAIELSEGRNVINVIPSGVIKQRKRYYGDPDDGYESLLVSMAD